MVRMRQLAIGLAFLLAAASAGAIEARELGRLTAKAALVVDAQSGEVHFARNPDMQLPPASTTKILTGLIALRQMAPDDLMRVSTYASSMPPTKAYLRPGWSLETRDLMYAMMMRSANDASVVIAEGVAGSVPNFARLMNATARSLGAMQSNFVTPNGLPAEGHYTTAHDLTLIMRQALLTPGMRDIMSTRQTVIQPTVGSRKRIALRSTNKLLWRDDLHVIGKTGWTRKAKRCFVGAASANGREVIVAVLGSNNLWADVELLTAYGLGQALPGGAPALPADLQQAAAPGFHVPPDTQVWNRVDNAPADMPAAAPPPRSGRAPAAPTAPAMRGFTQTARNPRASAPQGDREDPRGSTLRYKIHLSSYKSRARADQLRKDVAKKGYRATVEAVSGAYRVSVGDFASRDDARKAARSLGRTFRVDPLIVASK